MSTNFDRSGVTMGRESIWCLRGDRPVRIVHGICRYAAVLLHLAGVEILDRIGADFGVPLLFIQRDWDEACCI